MRIKTTIVYFFTTTVLLFNLTFSFSQNNPGITLKGTDNYIKINQNNTLYIPGSLKAEDTTFIKNWGAIYLGGSVINNTNDTLFETDAYAGTVHYIGKDTFQIIGNNPTAFTHLFNDSTRVLKSDTNILVYGNFYINKPINLIGNIKLSSKVFFIIHEGDTTNFQKWGKVLNETEDGFLYNDSISSGCIIAEQISEDSLQVLGIGIHTSSGSGVYYDLKRAHHSKENAADGSIRKSYTLTPNDTVDTYLQIDYFEHDFSGTEADENNFKLWYSEDFYNFTKIGDSEVNPENNSVYTTGSDAKIYANKPKEFSVSDEICKNPPFLALPADTFICEGTGININSGANNNYVIQWFQNSTMLEEDSSVLQNVNTEGIYWVIVTDSSGCFNIDSVFVDEILKPDAGFDVSPHDDCLYNPISFFNRSDTTVTGDLLEYLWNFSDGTTSTEVNPVKYFSASGSYDITLSAISEVYGCSDDTVFHSLIIHSVPTAGFETENQCINQEAYFINTSAIDTGNVINFCKWIFGDGTDTTLTNFDVYTDMYHHYGDTGIYNVSIIVGSDKGCYDSISAPVQIYPFAKADFIFEGHCEGAPINFTSTSQSEEPLEFYMWDFGNGETSYDENPTVVYDTSGVFSVKLTTGFYNACINSIEHDITINPAPDASFTGNNICEDDSVLFINKSLLNNDSLSFLWDFGNGEYSDQQDPVMAYPDYGTYTVKLIATSQMSCTDTASSELSVYPKPLAEFSADNVCFGDTTYFENTTSIPEGSITTYNWYYIQYPGSSSAFEPEITFNQDGFHEILLIAKSEHNCIDSVQNTIEVDSVPFLDLGGTVSSCTSSFLVDAENPGANYLWSDGNTEQVDTIYAEGNYSVQITYPNTCEFTEDFLVKLNTELLPNLGNNTTACDSVQLDAHNQGSTYLWSTGDTTQSVTVQNSGIYSVIVTNIDNCVGYDTIQVTINQSPLVDLGEDINVCETEPVILTAYTPNGESILWSTDETTQSITVNESNTYGLQLTSLEGCTGQDLVHVEFYTMPEEPFLYEDTSSCNPISLNALNLGFSYLWNTGATSRVITAETPGVYHVQIYNPGCSLSDQINVNIDPVPIVNIGDDREICYGDIVTLNAGNEGNYYKWSNGSNDQTITVHEPGTYGVWVTNTLGCQAYDEVTVGLLPSPVFDFGGTQTICNGNAVILDPNIEADTYEWYNETGLISHRTSLEIDEPGIYWLFAENIIGCSFSDTVEIFLNPNSIEADFLIASEIYDGDTVQIVDLSSPGFGSYLWYFGDGTTSTDTDPIHVWYVPGNYVVTLNIENQGCSGSLSKDVEVMGNNKNIKEEKVIISAEKEDKIKSIKLYPNPNTGRFTCEMELSEEYDVYVRIYNINGVLLKEERIPNQSHMKEDFSVTQHTSGLYIFKVFVEDESRVVKFVKY